MCPFSICCIFWYLEAILSSPPITPLLSQLINSVSPLPKYFHVTRDVHEIYIDGALPGCPWVPDLLVQEIESPAPLTQVRANSDVQFMLQSSTQD